MRKTSLILLWLLLILFIINVGLIYQTTQFKDIASNELSSRQRAEWAINDGIKNIGKTLPIDSIPQGHHFILRYDMTSCMSCVLEAEALLENVFGRDSLFREMFVVGVEGPKLQIPKQISTITYNEILTPMDEIYTPYFCYINDQGQILFSLALQPREYDFNRDILMRLKKELGKS